jgi:hypothetical protein
MTKQIPLSGKYGTGKFALVDDENYEFLMQWKWHYSSEGYAVRRPFLGRFNGKKKSTVVKMHRLINKTPDGMETDHINGDKLDNRKRNLRSVTKSQNMMNAKKKSNNKSGYKGVYFNQNKWRADIWVGGRTKIVGRFDNKIDAALAYNAAAIEHYGEFAKLNEV